MIDFWFGVSLVLLGVALTLGGYVLLVRLKEWLDRNERLTCTRCSGTIIGVHGKHDCPALCLRHDPGWLRPVGTTLPDTRFLCAHVKGVCPEEEVAVGTVQAQG